MSHTVSELESLEFSASELDEEVVGHYSGSSYWRITSRWYESRGGCNKFCIQGRILKVVVVVENIATFEPPSLSCEGFLGTM